MKNGVISFETRSRHERVRPESRRQTHWHVCVTQMGKWNPGWLSHTSPWLPRDKNHSTGWDKQFLLKRECCFLWVSRKKTLCSDMDCEAQKICIIHEILCNSLFVLKSISSNLNSWACLVAWVSVCVLSCIWNHSLFLSLLLFGLRARSTWMASKTAKAYVWWNWLQRAEKSEARHSISSIWKALKAWLPYVCRQ